MNCIKNLPSVSFISRQRLYKTLSEVKSEVEMVIKTGRQIVQRQQTEKPKELDERLTSLKLLYNDLGSQVGYKSTALTLYVFRITQ